MRVAAIVQARMGSTRLPGKSLMPVWRDMPLLELVLRRVATARKLDEVVLATSDRPEDDPLAELGEHLGAAVFRGDAEDVLGRFVGALDEHPADAVVRVCADNPFVAPEHLDRLVEYFKGVDDCVYARSTTEASGIADGFGAEIASADALRAADAHATEPRHREHVTLWLTDQGDFVGVADLPPPERPLPWLKLDVDTREDYERMRALADALPEESAPLWPAEAIVERYLSLRPIDSGSQSPWGSPIP